MNAELSAILGPQGLPDHGLHDVLRFWVALKWPHPYLVLRILLHGTGMCSDLGGGQLPAAPGVWGRVDFPFPKVDRDTVCREERIS